MAYSSGGWNQTKYSIVRRRTVRRAFQLKKDRKMSFYKLHPELRVRVGGTTGGFGEMKKPANFNYEFRKLSVHLKK